MAGRNGSAAADDQRPRSRELDDEPSRKTEGFFVGGEIAKRLFACQQELLQATLRVQSSGT